MSAGPLEMDAGGVNLIDQQPIRLFEADVGRCKALYDGSLVLAASLNPIIGYEQAARLAARALVEGIGLK